MTEVAAAFQKLKINGFKLTKQRKTMVTYLGEFQHQYIPITKVDQFMRQQFPGLSHNTIYRNVRDFVSLGILEQQNEEDQTWVKFQCDFTQEHHHHFICERCGKVIELKRCPLAVFDAELPGVEIHQHQIELSGLCAACVKAEASNI